MSSSGATWRPRWSRSASAPAWEPPRSSSGCESESVSPRLGAMPPSREGWRHGLSYILRGPHSAGARDDETETTMPKIDIAKIPIDTGSGYPEPLRRIVAGRERKRLGNAAGLDQFGV